MSQQRIGRYEILRPLGKGAMGVVYLARDPLVERDVALKTVRFDTTAASFGAEEAKLRFLKEAKISGRLQHPHIVTVFDVGEDGGNLYLAMEYVAGGSFQQKLQEGSLSIEDRLRVVLEVAEALGHAHDRGVIHRDIKPANILLTADLTAKVSDFGIGKLLAGDSELTSTGQMVGSPSYMSPEQVKGEKLDVRTDIFSLGVVLYQSLTAKKPFPADTLTTLVYQILHEEPVELSTLVRDLPVELSDIVRKCLAKSRTERYSNATEMAQDLGDLLGITPVTSTSSLSESKIRRAQRAATEKAAEKLSQARRSQDEGKTVQIDALPADVHLPSRTAPTRPVTVAPPPPPPPPSLPPARAEAPPPPEDGSPTTVMASGKAAAQGLPESTTATSPGGGRGRVAAIAAAAAVVLVVAGISAVKFLGGPGPEPTPPPPTPVAAVPATHTAAPAATTQAAPTPAPEVVPTAAPPATVTILEQTPPAPQPTATKRPPKPTATPAPVEPTAVPTPALRMPDQSVTARRYVKVNVSPSQARVFLDGKYVGISDDWDGSGGGAFLTFLAEGRHRLRLAHPGYRDHIVEIIVTARATDDRIELDKQLEKGLPEGPTGPPGKVRRPNYKTVNGIRFSVDPPTANITIAGRSVGAAKEFAERDLPLADQAVYDVILTAPGYEPKELRILRSPSAEEPRAMVKEKLKRL